MGRDNPAATTSQSSGALGEWAFGILDCLTPTDTCCMGSFCPCVLHGKTYARVHGDADSNGINSQCVAFAVLLPTPFSAVPGCIRRRSTREKYKIEGSVAGDFCASCCCTCNAIVQEYNEMIVRTTGINPKTDQPYISPAQMTHP